MPQDSQVCGPRFLRRLGRLGCGCLSVVCLDEPWSFASCMVMVFKDSLFDFWDLDIGSREGADRRRQVLLIDELTQVEVVLVD